jgi:hypothetical protein
MRLPGVMIQELSTLAGSMSERKVFDWRLEGIEAAASPCSGSYFETSHAPRWHRMPSVWEIDRRLL